MIQRLTALFILLIGILTGSCRDDLEYRQAADTLRFSKDTVFLDTVFSGVSSSTYNLKVYNTSDTDISIPEVYLTGLENSNFRLNVNGNAGKQFLEVEIPARDSIYIFVESTHTLSNLPDNSLLATDAIVFTDGIHQERVELVTLVQDAIFLFPNKTNGVVETILAGVDSSGNELRIEGFELASDQLTFTAEKPYVVYGYAAVPSGETLEIAAGARVHFHEASGLLVGDGARLQVNGTVSSDPVALENEVIFEGDRLEPEFSATPGQWGTVWLAEGSTDNHIDHLTIKNASIGIFSEGNATVNPPKLTLKNVTIINSARINLLARRTSVKAYNTVIGGSGQPGVYITEGGNYEFTHCTIANYWNNGLRSYPALLIDNFQVSQDQTVTAYPLTAAAFNNCIISGSASVEFLLNKSPQATFNVHFSHSLLQFDTTDNTLLNDPLYNFEDPALYSNNNYNLDPSFTNPGANKFDLKQQSPAINLGDPFYLGEIPTDINGNPRTPAPDSGAYEFTGN